MAILKMWIYSQVSFIKFGFHSSFNLEQPPPGTSLVLQWLRLRTFNRRSRSSVPAWGTKIPHKILSVQFNDFFFKKKEF